MSLTTEYTKGFVQRTLPATKNMLPVNLKLRTKLFLHQCAVEGLCHMMALWLFQMTPMCLASDRVDYKTILYY